MSFVVGKSAMGLLQKGLGVRGGPVSAFTGRGIFGGLPLSSTRDETETKSSAGNVDLSRRFLNTRARKKSLGDARKPMRKYALATPNMEVAQAMPLSVREMANSELITLGAMKNSEACKEILRRHVMTVDNVSYETACDTFEMIAEKNREGMWLLTVPYKVGIFVAITAATCSFPLVFDLGTVEWFNQHYVTADVPEPRDLETPLEVGSWAWNWMEPPLGQISFVLLCMSYVRAQIQNIGIRPYTANIMKKRAERLAAAFPQYNADVIMNFAEAVQFYGDKHGIKPYI